MRIERAQTDKFSIVFAFYVISKKAKHIEAESEWGL